MSINMLFASAVLCIIIATLRAAQITSNTIRTNADTDGTWLAVWGMAECAVAVIIGLTPSFAILFRADRKPDDNIDEVQLTTIGGSGGSGGKNKRPMDSLLVNDSQEDLSIKRDASSISTSALQDEEIGRVA
ncbi:cfem domain-containing [Pyrenophora seminiperda CCB06]|uniref:Cfem domain-containing n=1 Tax=Pyrenophora seminiperda CCB06 TaxID=1302712 RepID=A0A3M7M2X1_9PLEO|nr:cfem domain-containing [Pyrenophora seminiperda CCB06]